MGGWRRGASKYGCSPYNEGALTPILKWILFFF